MPGSRHASCLMVIRTMKKTTKKLSFKTQSVRALTVSSLKVPQGGLGSGETYTDSCHDTCGCPGPDCGPSYAATYRGCIG